MVRSFDFTWLTAFLPRLVLEVASQLLSVAKGASSLLDVQNLPAMYGICCFSQKCLIYNIFKPLSHRFRSPSGSVAFDVTFYQDFSRQSDDVIHIVTGSRYCCCMCNSAPWVLCCDRFDRSSSQAKREPVDLVTEDIYVSLCQRILLI